MKTFVYLDQVLNVWFWLFFLFFCYFLYDQAKRHFFESEISIKDGLDKIKKSIVQLIIFYQSNYNESDQIALIKKWMDSLDMKNINEEQWELFLEYVNNLKRKIL